ncbi:hypothetical protein [Actinoplanes couchii]|uniref:PknH-like extracellular domain-containing protein n=1 Tax=Actinoplanes couchii TaxID=403638 RepID=A0ABQ3X0V6_9ACTN|nr:hypothetical protein [Actinoplanes couchii]MDR6316482.1 tetrahydromethanopterin S-methyltransferase subunit F [Actinoplanes couchii]GID52097.1 hypothetical protein Aco03nite_005010 [Actinoplanes couchii]
MNKQLFDELVEDAPPSTVDVAGIVGRERRRRFGLRLTGIAAGLAAVGVVAGLVVQNPATSPSPPAAVAGGFRLVSDTDASVEQTARRLEQALDEALRATAPDARWRRLFKHTAADGEPPMINGKAAADVAQQVYSGSQGVETGDRRGMLRFLISSPTPCTPGAVVQCEDASSMAEYWANYFTCAANQPVCAVGTLPDGRRTKAVSTGANRHRASVELPDKRVLAVEVSNRFALNKPLDPDGAPLTLDQTEAVARSVAGRILP